MLKLYILSDDGTQREVFEIVLSVSASGDAQQCARSLDFSYLKNALDVNFDKIDIKCGNHVLFMEDDRQIFEGNVFSVDYGTGGSTVDVHCFDWGFFLNHNFATYKFTGQTAEQIARRICVDFGIEIGEIAATGIGVTHNFFNASLYEIIMFCYDFAGTQSGRKYYTIFEGKKLCIRQLAKWENAAEIKDGVNLIDCNISESVENMINSVIIFDKDENKIVTLGDKKAQGLYGLMQKCIKQGKNENARAEAQALIDDNGFARKIDVDCLGNLDFLTGGSVMMKNAATDTFGVFYIISDLHTWKNGLYFCKLTLDFKGFAKI